MYLVLSILSHSWSSIYFYIPLYNQHYHFIGAFLKSFTFFLLPLMFVSHLIKSSLCLLIYSWHFHLVSLQFISNGLRRVMSSFLFIFFNMKKLRLLFYCFLRLGYYFLCLMGQNILISNVSQIADNSFYHFLFSPT